MKYVFESNINFFDELYKSLDIEEKEEENEDDICLITKQNLCDRFVKMNCGHKFNYLPLYNDILNHKKKFNSMESRTGALHNNEIRCPYCRNKQTGVLPYYEDLSLLKVNGVNYYDPSIDDKPNYTKCEFLTPKVVFENDEVEKSANSDEKKFIKCYLYGSKIIGENYGDTKCYCYYHKKIIIKNKKKELLEKKKQEKEEAKQKIKEEKLKIKEEKLKIKEEAKKEKEEAKKEKEEAKKEKEEAKKEKEEAKQKIKKIKQPIKKIQKDENVVLGNIVIGSSIDSNNNTVNHTINDMYCVQILKTGENKGKPCSKKVFDGHLCKRHYQMQNAK
jgi:septum formation inhibitor MinC